MLTVTDVPIAQRAHPRRNSADAEANSVVAQVDRTGSVRAVRVLQFATKKLRMSSARLRPWLGALCLVDRCPLPSPELNARMRGPDEPVLQPPLRISRVIASPLPTGKWRGDASGAACGSSGGGRLRG